MFMLKLSNCLLPLVGSTTILSPDFKFETTVKKLKNAFEKYQLNLNIMLRLMPTSLYSNNNLWTLLSTSMIYF